MKNLFGPSKSELKKKIAELEARNAELEKRSFALTSVVDTMNYLSGQSELETNLRMVLDHNGIGN